jgi:hypothetical protein
LRAKKSATMPMEPHKIETIMTRRSSSVRPAFVRPRGTVGGGGGANGGGGAGTAQSQSHATPPGQVQNSFASMTSPSRRYWSSPEWAHVPPAAAHPPNASSGHLRTNCHVATKPPKCRSSESIRSVAITSS